jgi:predicted dehydrogenase
VALCRTIAPAFSPARRYAARMRALNVGFVGYGYATRTFHAPLVAATPGLRLAAVATTAPATLAADWPDVPALPTADVLFARPDIDLVVIATTNDSHFPLAHLALASGKHVVVDKPFTLTAADGRALETLANANARVLSVFHNRRWDADFLTLKQLLAEKDAGLLGRVVHFESHFDRYRPSVRDRWRERNGPGSGLWYDLGPHLLDQTLQLFGRPEGILLDTAQHRDAAQIDDYFHAVLRYGALRVHLHADMLSAHLPPRFTIHGTNGSLTKHGLDPQEDALKAGLRPPAADWGRDLEPFTFTTIEADRRHTRDIPALPGDYAAYYAALRDCLRGEAPNPVPPSEAISVIELLELGLESAALRREISFSGISSLFV